MQRQQAHDRHEASHRANNQRKPRRPPPFIDHRVGWVERIVQYPDFLANPPSGSGASIQCNSIGVSVDREAVYRGNGSASTQIESGIAFGQIRVQRVTVRNQRSRWGSCSRRGTISLNWRLVQTPEFVRDYIVLHELAHLREMNHSPRFWREVARLCPNFAEAEKWLKANAALLR